MSKSLSRQLTKNATIVALATFLSRLLGFVRDVIIAYALGAGLAADAFYVAFRLPNTLRRLFAEGSMTMAFVPIYQKLRKEKGEEAAQVYGRSILAWLIIILSGITILALIFAKEITFLIAPGFAGNPEQFTLAVDLVRIVFPYIILISGVALCMGILNSHDHFLTPALAMSELNVSIILGAGVALFFGLDVPYALAWSVIVGGVGQWLMQQPALKRYGFSWHGKWFLNLPEVKETAKLMIPTIFGAAVYQINIILGTIFASWLPTGSISWLYYADRLVQFPLGVFAVAIGTVALPSLSRLAAEKDMPEFKETLLSSLHLTLFICLPATAGLIALAEPMVDILFARGAFTALDIEKTSLALMAFGIGLPAFGCVKPLVSALFALKDAKTPTITAALSLLVYLVAALLLMGPLEHVGLALATSISSWANILFLVIVLRRKIGKAGKVTRTIPVSLILSLFIGVLAGAAFYYCGLSPLVSVLLIIPLALAYMGLALFFKVEEAGLFLELLRRGKRPPSIEKKQS